MFYYFDVRDSVDNIIEQIGIPVISTNEGGNFVDMFTPEIIAGDAYQAFTMGKTMLTESVAKMFFGEADPIGKRMYLSNSNSSDMVAAVCKDFPENCSFKNGMYISRQYDNPSNYSYTSYVELTSGKEKILSLANKDLKPEEGERQTVLTTLTDIHLKFPSQGKGSLSATLSLLVIGILLIIIAYINFINFAAAMAPVRLKSFNMRRIFGETSFLLKLSVVMESVFLSFLSFLLSIFVIHYFNGGVIKEFFLADLSLSKNIGLLLSVGTASLIMGFLAGLYPAFYSTSFKPAIVINGSFSNSPGSRRLKSVLITIQFVSVIFLIILSGFIKLQHNYMRDKSWGMRKENVVYLNIGAIRSEVKNFEAELRKNPDIYDITYSRYIPGIAGMMNWSMLYEQKPVKLTVWPVTADFLRFFDVKIIEGRDFQIEDDHGKEKIIFNSTFVQQYEFSNLTGKEFSGFNYGENENDMADIVGTIEDVNFESLHEPVKPMAFIVGKKHWNWMNWMFVRINGQNTAKSMDYIRTTWQKFNSYNINVTSLNDTHNQLYRQENNLAQLISICGLITIIVAIMGLYGLILFNAKSKRKTIALHKVHGASKWEAILLLNKGFLIQFTVAYVVAVPLAYYAVSRWLENFAYKTPIHWWVFVLGGLLVFAVTVLTVSWQSYRAASVNPIEAIKSE
jgi:putative ABC transport system permease protein